MSKDDNDGKKPPYDVGYGKPPITGRFVKGRSGNPLGRKIKAPRSLQEEIGDIFREEVTVLIGGRPQKMSVGAFCGTVTLTVPFWR